MNENPESYQVVILAGGLGTRLLPLTETTPKSLIVVASRPFIFWQLDLLAANKINEVVLCVGYLGKKIETSVGYSYKGISIKYVYEQHDKLLGTGGAIKKAESLLRPFFGVLYGDSFLEIDYRKVFDIHKQRKLPMTMTVWENNNNYDISNVVLSKDKTRVIYYEKIKESKGFRYIDYGFSVIEKNIVSDRFKPYKPLDIGLLQCELSRENNIGAFVVNKRFYEIGSMEGLKELENYLMNHKNNLGVPVL